MIYTISVTHFEDIRAVISYLIDNGFITIRANGTVSGAYLDTRTNKWCALIDITPENATIISLTLGVEVRKSPPEDEKFYKENMLYEDNPCGEIAITEYPLSVFKYSSGSDLDINVSI